MKVNSIPDSKTNFKAKLGGEFSKVVRISLDGGLSSEKIPAIIKQIHHICPKKSDKVNFYFRKNYRVGDFSNSAPYIRSGIKVVKDGRVMELNINPQTISQKNLLERMALGVESLVTGRVKPDVTYKFYDANATNSWISQYREPQSGIHFLS